MYYESHGKRQQMTDKAKADLIPSVTVASGEKFVTPAGIHAIKDGIKTTKEALPRVQKPDFLRMRVRHSPKYESSKTLSNSTDSTVCQEAKCPNISEYWSSGTATIMLMGDVCTRACRFCSVNTGNPRGWLDHDEPVNTAKAVQLMGLHYVVLTSVNRDDLGRRRALCQTVREVKTLNPHTGVEALTPDFLGLESAIDVLLESDLDVFAQNIETVKRLTSGS